jgi:drug/metabolite transporter (DMT)-like permease
VRGQAAVQDGTVAARGAPTRRSSRRGYLLVAGSWLVVGLSGVLVRMADAPASVLVVLRMGSGALVVAALFARRRTLAQAFRPGTPPRLLLMGACSAAAVLLFFIAVRGTNVALALFLLYTAPVYVALLAPRLLHEPSSHIVYLALGVAVAGMATIVVPDLLGEGAGATAPAIAAGVAAGALFGLYTIVVKSLTPRVGNAMLVLSEMGLDALIVLPLALWQVGAQDYRLTGRDLVIGLILGLFCTAFPYTLWFEGVRHIPVQHASILGYLAPVVGPFYAYLLLGEVPSAWTVAGGALIIAAGVLVVVCGGPAEETPPT